MGLLSLLLTVSLWQPNLLTLSPQISSQIQLINKQSGLMSKVECQSEGPKDRGASGFIFKCSLALAVASHVALSKVLAALNFSESTNKIKIFTWQRDCEDLIR